MSYQHDLFISYKTNPQFNFWTRDHMYRMLSGYLRDELPQSPRIFIDYHTQTGENWVNRIGTALGSARVLLAVFTPPYFTSKWCTHELDLMHKRLLNVGDCRLIFPVMASGSRKMLPVEIEKLQMYDLSKFRSQDIPPGTKAFARFSKKVKRLSSQIASAIQNAPPYDASWEEACKDRLDTVYRLTSNDALALVESLTLKSQPQQLNVPRVIL